jgi:hypothetical protein
MKKLYTTIILTIIYISANAQAPDWAWAKGAGGAGDDYNSSVATDASGNVYITGRYSSPSITFGTITLTNADITGNTNDIFIVKYDATGNVLWAKGAGGTSNDRGFSITTDYSSNVYVTGCYFSSSIAFETITLSNAGSQDIFIVKYDASGNLLWAKGEGTAGNDYSESITSDTSGNLYITGYYNYNSINFGVTTLSNSGAYDIFIVKYDASGNVLWAKGAGGTEFDEGLSIVTDASSNVYITGFYYSPSITFGTITLTNADITGNSTDIFIVKYDASGNLLWAKGAGGTEFDQSNSIITDVSGNLYVTGFYNSPSITFGSTILNNANAANLGDIFIVKYDALGNVLWANRLGGTGDDRGYNINTDASGNLNVTGYYNSNSINFGVATLSNSGGYDIFIVKYDASGTILWAKGAGSTGDDYSRSAITDASGNVFVSGYYTSPFITFSTISLTNANAGSGDAFIVKLNCGPTPILTTSSSTTFCIGDSVSLTSTPASSYLWSTNDTTQNITVSTSGSYYVNVTYSIGCTVSSTPTTVTANPLPAVDLGNDVSVCDGDNAVLTANATGGLSPYNYSWSNGLGNANTYIVTPSASSTYTVNVTDSNNCSSNTDSVTITLNPLPPTPTVGINGTQLTSSVASAYQWFDCDNGFVAIAGETNQSFTATVSGNYAVLITDNGCSDTSACFNVFVVGLNANNNISNISIYPNPANSLCTIQTTRPLLIEIYLLEGNLIESKKINTTYSFDISNYANGLYLVKATDNSGGFYYYKLVKQ